MLTVITGPMFAGKTTRLLSLARANLIAGNKVCYFKPQRDDRFSTYEIVTHNGEAVKAISVKNGIDIVSISDEEECDVVCIDEAQFLGNLKLAVELLIYDTDAPKIPHVIVAGLSQDSSGKPFGAMPHLLAIADDIIHLKAVCAKTHRINGATRTFRKNKENSEQVAIGGTEMYEPRSFKEWLKET